MARRHLLLIVAAIVLAAAVDVGLRAPGWLEDGRLRRVVAARNAAYDTAHPRHVGLADLPPVDLDRLDVTAACLPIQGLVDKARCAKASEDFAKRHPAG